MPVPQRLLRRYGVAVFTTFSAFLFTLATPLHERFPFALLLAATMVSALQGGLGPGLAATALSVGLLVLQGRVVGSGNLSLADVDFVVQVGLFVLAGSLASYLSRVCRRAVESAARLHDTIAAVGDAVIFTDARGRVTFVNPLAQSLTGCECPDALGRPLASVFQAVEEETSRPVADPASAGLRTGDRLSAAPALLRGPNGAARAIDYWAEPVRDAGGGFEGTVHVFRDVSDRHHREQELRRLAEETQSAEAAREAAERQTGELTRANALLEVQLAERLQAEEALRHEYEQLQVDHERVTAELQRGQALLAEERQTADVARREHEQRRGEQERTEEELRRQKHFLESVLEQADAAIVAWDATGSLTTLNRAARELLALAEGALPDRDPTQRLEALAADGGMPLPEEDSPFAKVRRGETVTDAVLLLAAGGKARALRASGGPIPGPAGQPQGAVLALHDVTASRRDEAELRRALAAERRQQEESGERGRRSAFLAEAGRDLATSLDPETVLRLTAQAAVPYLADWCTVQRSETVAPEVAEALRTGRPVLSPEISAPLLSGLLRDLDSAHPFPLEPGSAMCVPLRVGGQPLAAVSFVRGKAAGAYGPADLKLAEQFLAVAAQALANARSYQEVVAARDAMAAQALADARLYQQAAADRDALLRQLRFSRSVGASVGVGIYALDTVGRLSCMNPAAERLLGWTEAELLGKNVHELIHVRASGDDPSGKPSDAQVLEAIPSGPVVRDERVTFRRKDGTVLEVACTVSPIVADEHVEGAVVAFHDVTEQRRRDEELRRQAAGLVEAVRRHEAFRDRLAAELRDVSRGLEDVAGHEPAGCEVRRLTWLAGSLEDMSRLARGTLRLDLGSVELGTLLQHVAETAQWFLRAGRRELTVSLPLRPTRIVADPDRLARALVHLLRTAARFSDPGGRVRLTAERQANATFFHVHGDGIPPEVAPQLFGELPPPGEPDEGGAGGLEIGLGLVRSLVELHGGEVQAARPGPGQASWFTVRLPDREEEPLPRSEFHETSPGPADEAVGESAPALEAGGPEPADWLAFN
jgi:PAS domain S-box-containing protein